MKRSAIDTERRSALAAAAALGGLGLLAAWRPAAAQTRKLVTRSIPSTGEELPAIGLGTWQVFDVGNDAAARAPLREVVAGFATAGGKLIDSSPMYGRAEAVAGDLVDGLGLRERLFIATKVWTRGREAGIREMETSFRRLRVKQMDLMQVHNLLDADTHLATLAGWKASGRVRYVGITHYTASAHAEVERQLKASKPDFLQINYSLAEREAERRLLPWCRDNGVAVIANRPFAEGAMFGRVRGRPLPPWAADIGVASWAQYFLKWIIGHPAITCAIPGTGRPEHIADNVAAGLGMLPDAMTRKRMADHYESL